MNLLKKGRPRVLNQLRERRLIQAAKHRIGISQRKLARRFHVGKTTVFETLSRHNVLFRKRRKAPKYTDAQLGRIPRCCRALRRVHFANKLIVMDNKKYFTLANSEMKENDGFYTDDHANVPNDVRVKSEKKFEDKMLILLHAIIRESQGIGDGYGANNINFVPKVDNPPNLPQARPIEDF
ncbi:unnamed protein product [Phaedon cochleariae]|uniref:HTH psq-type domain-containing protein n=1 Tax=Phaedon cochleariae TaxID=80249 RepID=A0A9N9X2D1_PHACE|nr:unnamed protein product [Phaedon cochleariae]